MPKRGNENAQMRREEYEALESSSSKEVSHGFERAPEESLRKRRILSAKRPSGARPSFAGDNGDQGSISSSTSKPSNPFANVNLVSGANSSSKPTFSFNSTSTSTTDNKTAESSSSSKPIFSFGDSGSATSSTTGGSFSFGTTTTSNNTAATASKGGFSFGGTSTTSTSTSASKTGGFSFGASPTPAPPASTNPFSFSTGTTSASTNTNTSGTHNLREKYQKNARLLEECFQKEISQYSVKNAVLINAIDQYIDACHCLEDSYWSEVAKQGSSNESTKTTAASATTTATPGAAATGGFTPGTSSSFFSLGATPSSTVTTPATLTGGDTPAADGTAEFGDGVTPTGPPSVIKGNADEDWNDLNVLDSVHVYHYRNKETGGATKFCSGSLKVQQHVKSKSRRMIMRDPNSGKVLLNLSISKKTPVGGGIQKTKKHAQGIDHALFMSVQDQEIGTEKFSLKRRVVPGKPTLKEAMTEAVAF